MASFKSVSLAGCTSPRKTSVKCRFSQRRKTSLFAAGAKPFHYPAEGILYRFVQPNRKKQSHLSRPALVTKKFLHLYYNTQRSLKIKNIFPSYFADKTLFFACFADTDEVNSSCIF